MENNKEYRIVENVNLNTFSIEKRFLVNKKIENPNIIQKILLFLFNNNENEDEFIWHTLNVKGNYANMYKEKVFRSYEKAEKLIKGIKEKGETKHYYL